jgi:hypothetical protein
LLGEWFPVFLEDCNAFIFKGQPLPSVTAWPLNGGTVIF